MEYIWNIYGIYNHTNIYIYICVKHIWYIITSGMIFWDQEYMILYMESSVFFIC